MYIKTTSSFTQSLVTLMLLSLFNSKEMFASSDIQDVPNISETIKSLGLDIQNIEQFKEYLAKDISTTHSSTVEEFVDKILATVVAIKPREISDETIGIAFDEIAEKFSDHDYFSVDRLNGTLNRAQQEIENARLMRNWQKWYTFKLLAYFYKNEAMTKKDADVIVASMRSDNIDMYETSQEPDDQIIYALGKPFYTKKCNFVQTVYEKLTEKVDGFSTFMDSLYATEDDAEDETDTI
jgi:hypothetical protein